MFSSIMAENIRNLTVCAKPIYVKPQIKMLPFSMIIFKTFDEIALDLLSQRLVFENYDGIPSGEERKTAIVKFKNKVPGEIMP